MSNNDPAYDITEITVKMSKLLGHASTILNRSGEIIQKNNPDEQFQTTDPSANI